ncbi:hypothetical protein SteCoe_5558 [Stentor coeruleus]|uniref:Uncharacterized protein n=1 Tax=Stentor coeruleus TaxID=5963 RepID=A0A1R2CS27_9CILI|nr:hypothetical protein SteCoe_5558 [Stentor coeruleus]
MQDDMKYLDFQERMHKMLLRPEILSILQGSSSSLSETNEINDEGIKKPVQKFTHEDTFGLRKEQAEESRKQFSNQLCIDFVTENKCNYLINTSSNDLKKISDLIRQSIKDQDINLNNRLALRRTKTQIKLLNLSQVSQKKNLNSFNDSCIEENDTACSRSSFYNSEESLKELHEKYEKHLEELMEKSLNERSLKIFETKTKYESQICELLEGGGLLVLVANEMKKNLQEELSKITEFYDSKRKEDIKKLRNEIYN